MLMPSNVILCKEHRDYLSESCISPPLLCCSGSWDWFSTRRFCPMIQPQRGLCLSCNQKCTHCPVQISSCTCLPSSLTKSHLQFFSFRSSCLFFFQCLSLQSFPRPPSHNLLKTFPPCGSWTLSPTHSTTLPPWHTAQVSIYYKMPTIPGRGMSYVFILMGVLWHVVQIAQLIMYVKCNNSYMGLKRTINSEPGKALQQKDLTKRETLDFREQAVPMPTIRRYVKHNYSFFVGAE